MISEVLGFCCFRFAVCPIRVLIHRGCGLFSPFDVSVKPSANEFVEGVMSTHIFRCGDNFSVALEEGTAVNSAGMFEAGLGISQCIGQSKNDVRIHFPLGLWQGDFAFDLHRIDGGFAAYAATGSGVKMSFHRIQINHDAIVKFNGDAALVGGFLGGNDVLGGGNDAFGEQKSQGEFYVVARGSHGDGDIFFGVGFQICPGESNFQRFFYGHKIIGGEAVSVLQSGDFGGGYAEFGRQGLGMFGFEVCWVVFWEGDAASQVAI